MRTILSLAGVVLWFGVTVASAQQPLTPQQQCANHVQELVLSDISYQELRARFGNIMRQAYELESKEKVLMDELAKEKAAHASTKEALANLKEVQDANSKE